MQTPTLQYGHYGGELSLSKKVFEDMIVLRNEIESIIETLEIMSDKELMEGIKRGEKDYAEGRFTECKNKDEMHKFLDALKD